MTEMIADIYKVCPLTYLMIFPINGSEFEGDVTRLLQKHKVRIKCVMSKYKHTHTAFIKALNKILAEQLFQVQDTQELNDNKKMSQT